MGMTRAERRRQKKEANKKPVQYQCTPQQLQAIQKMAVENYKARMDDHVAEVVYEEWKKREAALTGATEEDSLLKVMSLMLAVTTTVLCEKFHWLPVYEDSDRRSKLKRFSEAVVDEVERICKDETIDIRTYGEEVCVKYGVKYQFNEADEGSQ